MPQFRDKMHAFKCGPSGWKLAQDTKFFPKIESTNEDWGGVSLYDLALKLLSTPPLANTLETVGVVAVGENPEAALAGAGFLVDHLHANATHHVLAALHREWELHVLLVGLDAGLESGQRGAVRSWNRQTAKNSCSEIQTANGKENCSQHDIRHSFVHQAVQVRRWTDFRILSRHTLRTQLQELNNYLAFSILQLNLCYPHYRLFFILFVDILVSRWKM